MPKQTETTYESEMSQPVHRPGMERVVNRTNPDGTRQVSPPTRSAFGADSASTPAPKEEAPAAVDRQPLPLSGKGRTAANLDTADQNS